MTLSELIVQFAEQLYRLWPFRVLNAWECGFKLTLGKPGKPLKPGLKWIWPFLQELITEEKTREIDQIYPVTVTTVDGKTITVVMAAEYRITDVRKMYTTITDHDETVLNRIAASVGTQSMFMWAERLPREIASAVLDDCRGDLVDFGVDLISCEVVSVHPVRALRLITGE